MLVTGSSSACSTDRGRGLTLRSTLFLGLSCTWFLYDAKQKRLILLGRVRSAKHYSHRICTVRICYRSRASQKLPFLLDDVLCRPRHVCPQHHHLRPRHASPPHPDPGCPVSRRLPHVPHRRRRPGARPPPVSRCQADVRADGAAVAAAASHRHLLYAEPDLYAGPPPE